MTQSTQLERHPSGADAISPVQSAVDVIAITTHDDFLLELGDSLGGHTSIRPVDSVAAALNFLGNSKQPQILAIDARDVPDLRDEIQQIQTKSRDIPVLIFAEAELQEVAAALKASCVFAVLPMPIDAQMTAAIFEGAVADAAAKRQASSLAPSLEHMTVESLSAPKPAAEPAETKPLRIKVALLAAVVLPVACGIWYFTGSSAPPTTESPPAGKVAAASAQTALESPPVVESTVVQGQVDELLEKARLAMRERRYAEPTGDNALLYFRSAAAANPGNGEAADGLSRLGTLLRQRFEEAMASPPYEGAALVLAQLKTATPADTGIGALEMQLTTAQVSRAIADGNVDRAATLVRNAEQAGTVPPDLLAKWGADIARLQEAAKRKQLADEQAAREALAAEQQRKVREAQTAAEETERRAQLGRERERQEALLKAEQATKAAQPVVQAQDANGASPPSGSPAPIPLKRTRYTAPEYPSSAASRGIGGTVTVAFIVTTEGATRDIRVESADPAGVFDRAAITAVQRWRYEPTVVNGKPIEVPTRALVRFAAPK